jgi:tetratricopeptide (TPR) repeat protein
MTGSALDDFAAASSALRRLANAARSAEPDVARHELRALRLRYPDAFARFPEPSADNGSDQLDAVTAAGGAIAGDLSDGLLGHANDKYRERRFRDAVRLFGLVLVIDPGSAVAAVMHASAMELSHARANFLKPARRATILAPLDAGGWKLAMRGSFAAGDLATTQKYARRHVLLEPRSRDGWFILARARFRAGEAGDALPVLRLAAVLAPATLDIRLALSRCLFRLGHFAEALSANDAAADLGANGREYTFERARIAHAAGRRDIAGPLLDALATGDPGYAHLREVLELTATADDLRASPR